jgi:hypothetical protein
MVIIIVIIIIIIIIIIKSLIVYMMCSEFFLFSLTPSKLAQEVKPLIWIWEVLSSSVDWNPVPWPQKFVFFTVPPSRCRDIVLKEAKDYFSHYPFKFNDINHSLTSPSTK